MRKFIILIVLILLGCSNATPKEKMENYLQSKSYTLLESHDNIVSFETDVEVGSIWFSESGDLFKTVRTNKSYSRAVEVKTMISETSTVFVMFILEESVYTNAEYAIISFSGSDNEEVIIDLGDDFKYVWIMKLEECISSCSIDRVELFSGEERTYLDDFIPS